MSEDKSLRLDPKTLRHVADRLRAGLEMVRKELAPEGPDAAFEKCILAMAAEAEELAAEAENLPPMASDWIRATVGTGLGEPEITIVIGAEGRRWFDVRFASMKPLIGDSEVASFCEFPHSDDAPRGYVAAWTSPTEFEHVGCRTPAELRAALERLAEDVA